MSSPKFENFLTTENTSNTCVDDLEEFSYLWSNEFECSASIYNDRVPETCELYSYSSQENTLSLHQQSKDIQTNDNYQQLQLLSPPNYYLESADLLTHLKPSGHGLFVSDSETCKPQTTQIAEDFCNIAASFRDVYDFQIPNAASTPTDESSKNESRSVLNAVGEKKLCCLENAQEFLLDDNAFHKSGYQSADDELLECLDFQPECEILLESSVTNDTRHMGITHTAVPVESWLHSWSHTSPTQALLLHHDHGQIASSQAAPADTDKMAQANLTPVNEYVTGFSGGINTDISQMTSVRPVAVDTTGTSATALINASATQNLDKDTGYADNSVGLKVTIPITTGVNVSTASVSGAAATYTTASADVTKPQIKPIVETYNANSISNIFMDAMLDLLKVSFTNEENNHNDNSGLLKPAAVNRKLQDEHSIFQASTEETSDMIYLLEKPPLPKSYVSASLSQYRTSGALEGKDHKEHPISAPAATPSGITMGIQPTETHQAKTSVNAMPLEPCEELFSENSFQTLLSKPLVSLKMPVQGQRSKSVTAQSPQPSLCSNKAASTLKDSISEVQICGPASCQGNKCIHNVIFERQPQHSQTENKHLRDDMSESRCVSSLDHFNQQTRKKLCAVRTSKQTATNVSKSLTTPTIAGNHNISHLSEATLYGKDILQNQDPPNCNIHPPWPTMASSPGEPKVSSAALKKRLHKDSLKKKDSCMHKKCFVGKNGQYVPVPSEKIGQLMVRDLLALSGHATKKSDKEEVLEYHTNFMLVNHYKRKRLMQKNIM